MSHLLHPLQCTSLQPLPQTYTPKPKLTHVNPPSNNQQLPLTFTCKSLQSLLCSPYSIHPSQIHSIALKLNQLSNPHLFTSLLLAYTHHSHSHSPDTALSLLTQSPLNSNPITWTLLLKQSKPTQALQLFDKMLKCNVELDSIVLLTIAKACGRTSSFLHAKKIQEVAKKNGFLEDDVLVGNSIVKMWLECGKIEEARRVFEGMKVKDLVSWTTIVNGYVRNGEFNEGLKLFRGMCASGERVDSFAVSAVLPACGRMAASKNGKEVHGKIVRMQLGGSLTVENALMDMYVKSGRIEAALKIFERMTYKDVISWTVMIMGCSLHGQGEIGLELFKKMKGEGGVLPDNTTFAAALHAANTACLVEEGKTMFSLIAKPGVEHFSLVAGLQSRGGYFIEARMFIEEHHLTRCVPVHRAVLDGCRIHQNVKLGKRIVEQLIELEPLNAANYVLLSNVYAASENWELAKKLRETIQDMGLKAKMAYSWIEIRNKVHVFGTGDVSHPRSEAIYWELERLMKRMREEGYIAREDFSLHDVDEERECIPSSHSEMLAIGLGLISSSQTSGVLRVTKNLRLCRNCHDSAKLISKIVDKEIVLKDPDRFHHFRGGICSCKDMW